MNKTGTKLPANRQKQLNQQNIRKRQIHSSLHTQKSSEEVMRGDPQASRQNSKQLPNAVTSTHWCLYDRNCHQFVGLREEQQR